eukprot:4694443-Pyramimonas_sp.AAC.1
MGRRIRVDDLAQRAVGSRASARQKLVVSLHDTCQGLRATRLQVAPKSVVVRPHHPDTVRVRRALRLAGFS